MTLAETELISLITGRKFKKKFEIFVISNIIDMSSTIMTEEGIRVVET